MNLLEKTENNASNTTPIFLLLETATEVCSVSLSVGEEIVSVKESSNGFSHAEHLLPFVDELFRQSAVEKKNLSAVVLSSGPGSYTGLRIGASTAKGICYALQIPLIAVPTLESIAQGCLSQLPNKEALLCPMIDARRMEVYTAYYDSTLEMKEEIHPQIVENDSFADVLENHQVLFCGNGMPKCQSLLSVYPNALFADTPLSSKNMLFRALQKWQNGQFEEIAYFEPFYLKNYFAKKSVVKGLY